MFIEHTLQVQELDYHSRITYQHTSRILFFVIFFVSSKNFEKNTFIPIFQQFLRVDLQIEF